MGSARLFSRSELLIESEARSAESLEARSAESLADVAPNELISIRVFIYFDVCTVLDSDNWFIGYVTRQWRARDTSCLSLFSASLRFSD